MTPAQLICKKRDGETLSDKAIAQFIHAYMDDSVTDYQMSAFAMAVYFQGMTTGETVALTRALLESGTTLSWDDSVPKVDKHSTGGIGDKISIVLAPLLASCGVQVPMLSGRGLGITGGTLDKLESIPGFRTDLTQAELQKQTTEVGCVITGASTELAPADRKLYALRDVTGTVPSQPLIVSSIMSKKLAENLSSLVLDVKAGSGAFMKSLDDATSLGNALVAIGSKMGTRTTALVTDMNQPLGSAVGNAVEVQEAIDALQGSGPADIVELTTQLGCELLLAEGIAKTSSEAIELQRNKIADGSAYQTFEQMVAAQHGSLRPFELADETMLSANTSGYLHSINSELIANFVIQIGGGRRIITDKIDHGVGVRLLAKVGSQIELGQPLLQVYARSSFDRLALQKAFVIGENQPKKTTLILDRLGG